MSDYLLSLTMCLPILSWPWRSLAQPACMSNSSQTCCSALCLHQGAKEASCGCAGVFSAPISLALYATVFEKYGALDKLEAFASFNGPDFYGERACRATVCLLPGESSCVVKLAGTEQEGRKRRPATQHQRDRAARAAAACDPCPALCPSLSSLPSQTSNSILCF